MKRFLSFLLFILLLAVAVLSLQIWKERGFRGDNLRRTVNDFFHRGSAEFRRPEKYTVAEGPRINVADVDVLAAMSRQRVLLAKAVVPSVVSITTSQTVQNSGAGNDPLFQLFHHNMRQRGALGSGAIVSREGHIVTNNHVIDQMDQIEVKLSDGRIKQATLIGTDPMTDIAVLKIEADDLQPLPFGNSDAVEVGETVMAIGNPYGLNESVTQGIISAKGRRGSENVSDLFQTDSAINPGNSGGPLVNVRGELIGINEAIFSESGGWQGVGFAVPADTVRGSMDSILKTGRVIHGYLGVSEEPVGDGGLRQRGLSNQKGVVVDTVAPGSPAEKADIRPGDFIQRFNDVAINDFHDLRHSVAEINVDTTVSIELLRNGKKMSVSALITERPPPGAQLSQMAPFLPPAMGRGGPPSFLNPHGGGLRTNPSGDADSLSGVQVTELDVASAQKLDLPPDVRGVVVKRVEPDTLAADKLQAGDVIEQINQQPIVSLPVYGKLVRALPEHRPVLLSIVRERVRTFVVLTGA